MASLSTFKPYELYNTVNYLVKVPRARSLPKKRAARPFTQHPSDHMGQMYPGRPRRMRGPEDEQGHEKLYRAPDTLSIS